MFRCIADLIRKIDTITYEELHAAIANLKLPEGYFLTQIHLPCAYAFSTASSIHHRQRALLLPGAAPHLPLLGRHRPDASESGRSWVMLHRHATAR